MLDSAMIDTAIGLFLVYLALSLIATAVQEGIASLRKARARNLRAGIDNLLLVQDGRTWGETLMRHPLIDSLSKGSRLRSKRRRQGEDERDGFSDSVAAPLRTQRVTTFDDHYAMGSSGGRNRTVRQIAFRSVGPSYIPAKTFRIALIDRFCQRFDLEQDADLPGELAKKLRHSPLGRTPLGDAVLSLATASKGNLRAFEGFVEEWYENSMQRVTGWYRRSVQIWLFAIGVALAVSLNADTVTIARTLYGSEQARASVVALASQTSQGAPPAGALLTELQDATIPLGWRPAATGGQSGTAGALQASLQLPQAVLSWEFAVRLIGWLLTALAVSFGAPFWFDLLQKVMNLRGTGPKPGERGRGPLAPGAGPVSTLGASVYRSSDPPRSGGYVWR